MSTRVSFAVVMATLGWLCTSAPANTIGYWRFEGADDATGFLYDSSGNGLVLARSTTPGVPQVALAGTGAGAAFCDPVVQNGATNGSAASLSTDSTNGCLATDYDESLLLDAFTIEAFISPSSLSSNTVLVGHFNTTPSRRRWLLGPTSGSQLRLALCSDGASSTILDTSAANWLGPNGLVTAGLSVDKDYYIGASIALSDGTNPGVVTYYLQDLTDGGPLLTQTRTHSLTSLYANTVDGLSIGAMANGNNPYPGLVDEVRLSGGVLGVGQLLVVPEPGTWLLAVVGGLIVAGTRWRKRG